MSYRADFGEPFDRALLQWVGVPVPNARPPGERHALGLFWPTYYAKLVVEVFDLGGTAAELSVAVLANDLIDQVMTAWARAPTMPGAVVAPTWHRVTLAAAALAPLRAQLDALAAGHWPALGGGRDGLGVDFWLGNGQGQQRVSWSSATHDASSIPGTLAVGLLQQARGISAVQGPVEDALRYLQKRTARRPKRPATTRPPRRTKPQ